MVVSRSLRVRNDPKLFYQACIEHQHELEREARSTLRVHCGRVIEEASND
jgi:hypothetical protein